MITESDKARFWKKVNHLGPDDCWNWTGAKKKPGGYGNFWLAGKYINAHKFSAILHDIYVEGCVLCHTCDNQSCVNPNHIYAGTIQSNMQDAKDRNRFNPWRRGMQVCDRGHEMTEDNIIERENKKRCKECTWIRTVVHNNRRSPVKKVSKKVLDRLANSGYTWERFEREFLS